MEIFVVVPVYNESERCIRTLKELLKYKAFVKGCIVVDDGSRDKTSLLLKKEFLKNTFFHILSHSVNMGKGAAMRTGCEFAWSKRAEAVVFIDGDGQHNVNLLPEFLKKLKKSQLVFGYRQFTSKMPFYRKMGNMLARCLVAWLFNIKRKDLLCGYFGLRHEIYTKVLWTSNRYGVETEIATLVGKNKLKFDEVEVDTIYLSKYKGVNPLDAVKILARIPGWYFQKEKPVV